jgi:ABC-type transport system involved in multi-copper enzyme maturation permease subunit
MTAPPAPMTDTRPLPPDVPHRTIGPLAGFWTSFTWGLRLTSSWKRLLLVGIVACGLAYVLGTYAIGGEHRNRPTDAWFDLWDLYDTSVLKFLLPIIALVIAARGFAVEVGERTLVYHLVRPISRRTLCVARFLSGVLPAALVSWATLVTLSLASGLDLPRAYWLSLPLTAGISTLAVGAVYYTFVTLLRYGMIGALVYTFVFEPLFSAQSGSMQKLSIMYHVRAIHHGLTDALFVERSENVRAALAPEDAFNLDFLTKWTDPQAMAEIRDRVAYETPTVAVITLACITIALVAFTAWRVSKTDYPLKD